MALRATLILKAYPLLSAVLIASILLWTLGLPFVIKFADAVSLTSVSDTLSDSDLGVPSNHAVVFTTPTGVANGETITITFPAGFDLTTIVFSDIDVATTSDFTVAANCAASEEVSAAVSLQVLTLTFCSGDGGFIPANGTTTVEIGTNATFGVGGINQITNPGGAGSYQIDIAGTQIDRGSTMVAIIDDVVVSAQVNLSFTFTISGLATGTQVNDVVTSGSSTATSLNFATLPLTPASSTLGQRLNVTTNARNGFTVTVVQDQRLTSSNGADIDSFANDSGQAAPIAWSTPTGLIGQENTYGHFGLTSDDDINTNEFGSALFVGNFATTTRAVFHNSGPADGITTSVGSTTVAYRIEITALQEAANDYTSTLTYVATPVF